MATYTLAPLKSGSRQFEHRYIERQRRDGKQPRVGVDARFPSHARQEIGDGIVMDFDAFRVAGRAGRVDDVREIVAGARRRVERIGARRRERHLDDRQIDFGERRRYVDVRYDYLGAGILRAYRPSRDSGKDGSSGTYAAPVLCTAATASRR